MQVCPGCGEGSPDRFTECPFCGHALSERHETHEERKVLTVVFCDLKDSTALGERLDPESLGEVLDLYFTAMTRVLKRHGGSIQKFIGDAIVAAFGIPIVHEDDALRAVRAASEMLEALDRLNRQLSTAYGVTLEVRTGVHTGEVVIRSASNDQQLLTGDTLNTAARLEQAAGSGEILLGGPTHRLVRDAVTAEAVEPLDLKGKAEPVPAYRLIRVFGDEQSSRRHNAPFVGREDERARLHQAFVRARDERRCHLMTVLGEAGVGKSRLVRALLDATADESAALRGRCLPYGEGITFWPIIAIVRDACGIDTDDSPDVSREKLNAVSRDPEVTRRVASALGWSAEQLPLAELFWGIRELLGRLADRRPLVVVVDDVHWAAPSLLELIDHLVDTLEGPMLLLSTARPDMLDANAEWGSGERRERLLLERLPDDVAGQVIDNLTDGLPLPDDVRTMIVRSSEGNPLFVEQLISMLVDSGTLVERDGSWSTSGDLRHLSVPPSIDALLVARLDLLTPEERATLEPAAVIGLEFPSRALRDLAPTGVADGVPAHLGSLARRQFVRPTTDGDRELDDHRFHHILIRDATYRRSLKRARADLHERFADWLERFDEAHTRSNQHDEVAGYHLEQAFHLRAELGSLDAHQRVLGSRAAEMLSAAGKRAFIRGDLPSAVDLMTRAIGTLPRHDPVRLALLPDLAEATMEMGGFDQALSILAEADDATGTVESSGEASNRARSRLVRLHVELSAGAGGKWAMRARQEIEASLAIFSASEHHAGSATAWRLAYGVEGAEGKYDAAAEAAQQVIIHARAAGDVRQERRASVAYAQSVLYGGMPVAQAAERCEELLTAVDGDRRSESLVQLSLAHLLAMIGRSDEARSLYRSSQTMLNDLGRSVLSMSTSIDSAAVEVLARDFDAAQRELRRDFQDLDAIGETYLRSTIGGLLARVLALTGNEAEAEQIALEAKNLAAPDDADAQVLWRSALGLACAHAGRTSEALTLVDEAVAIAQSGSDPHRAAQSLTDRATVLRSAGRIAESRRDLGAALEIHRTKGNVVEAAAVDQSLSALGEINTP